MEFRFSLKKCRACPYRSECNPNCKSGKKITVRILSEQHKRQKEFQESEYFKQMSKERYKIEAKNNELKNFHGYDVSVGNGLYATKIQGACTIFVANLKRIILLSAKK